MGTEKNIHYWLGIFNDFLMIPMLTFIIFDVTEPTPHPNREIVNLFFSASFFSEWAVGLWKTKERKSYLLSIEKISRLEKKMDLLLANQKIDSLNTKNIATAVDETEGMLQNIKDPNSDIL